MYRHIWTSSIYLCAFDPFALPLPFKKDYPQILQTAGLQRILGTAFDGISAIFAVYLLVVYGEAERINYHVRTCVATGTVVKIKKTIVNPERSARI